MDKNFNFAIKQISRLISATKEIRSFEDDLYKVVPFDEIPRIEEAMGFFQSVVWDTICETRGIPEIGDAEWECFQDCIYNVAFASEYYYRTENNEKILIKTPEDIMDLFSGKYIDAFAEAAEYDLHWNPFNSLCAEFLN